MILECFDILFIPSTFTFVTDLIPYKLYNISDH